MQADRSDLNPLHDALPGERCEIDSAAGRLSFYKQGSGPPLLLVHSVNAAASAAEVRPLYLHYSATRTVFSMDLPGFGFSERSDRNYTPQLMTDALHAMREEIARRCGPAPIDALALSLSCEFLARAAMQAPQAFASLALVSPTGLSGAQKPRRGPPGSTLHMAWLYKALRGPGWGKAVFKGLTRPGVIRFFLAKTWGSPDIDETLWQYDVLSARQPGAEFAPLHFISGSLFSGDINNVYETLRLPVWMCHGSRGDFTDYRAKTSVLGRPGFENWRCSVYATGALPHFEVPSRFIADYDAFLRSARSTASLRSGASAVETQRPAP